MRIVLVVCALGALGVVGASCSASDVTQQDSAKVITGCISIATVSPASQTIHVGDTLRVAAYFSGPSCQASDPLTPPIAWSSSDTATATVDASTGLVHARAKGTATIIATLVSDATEKASMALVVIP